MAASAGRAQKIVPAQVGFLALYNPSLGPTDETLDDQIVYYASPATQTKRQRRRRTSEESPPKSSQEERNERLRRIGLAQGMVEFGRDFSDGKAVDTIETEKSRIVLHELESGWWLLVSIDLTRIPAPKGASTEDDRVEYSSREVKPAALLLEDLLRAHSTFLLHHASSMSALFVRTRRPKFVNLLGRYWDSFLSTWNVMLHGNPLVNVFGGIKLAGSGELGVGVGEEDRGSGEREVLEGFVGRIEGLVDLVVSKFGDVDPSTEARKESKESQSRMRPLTKRSWLGTGAEPTVDDGAVFLGVGALSQKSLRDVTHWMEDLYSWGSRAYGVRENPTASRKSRRRKNNQVSNTGKSTASSNHEDASHQNLQLRPALDKGSSREATKRSTETQPTISVAEGSPESQGKKKSRAKRPSLPHRPSSQSSFQNVTTAGGKIVNYLKLGYGSHWSLGGTTSKIEAENENKLPKDDSKASTQLAPRVVSLDKHQEPSNEEVSDSSRALFSDSIPHYLIGLLGDIESEEAFDEIGDDAMTDDGNEQKGNYRMLLRTVTVELEREGDARPEADISIDLGNADFERSRSSKYGGSEHTGTSNTSFEGQDRNKTKKLRIVIYVNRPFIFAFFFELRTDALALTSLYRSLHYQLSPLQRPLMTSTSRPLSRPVINTALESKDPIYDLLWDSKTLIVSSTIPNIPEPQGAPNAGMKPPLWSRIEALNTHMQLLNIFSSTRSSRSELESTCKTSRGWWIVWNRIPDSDTGSISSYSPSPLPGTQTPQISSEETTMAMRSGSVSVTTGTLNHSSMYSGPAHPFLDRAIVTQDRVAQRDKEIFLLRRASDYLSGKSSVGFGSTNSATGESGWGGGTAKLAQGIGVDTKKYIEGLLNMNR